MWLVKFKYDLYCQGFEEDSKILLVEADNFKDACNRISNTLTYDNARDFENLTLLKFY